MKRYRITVNGETYDVAVEETSGASFPAQNQAAAARAAAPAAPAPKAAPAAKESVPKAAGNPESAPQHAAPSAVQSAASIQDRPVAATVKSPMPGVVMSFKVSVGQDIKKGDVLLILEAMKMENEIVAPQTGKVLSLHVPAGASVNTGDSLVDLG